MVVIYVVYLSKNITYELDVEKDLQIRKLKERIEQRIGIEINKLQLQKHSGRSCISLTEEWMTRTIFDAHIVNGDKIIIPENKLLGGGGVDFIDVSNDNLLKEDTISDKGPKWRIIYPGVSFRGKCHNSLCEANGQTVYCSIRKDSFEFVQDNDEIKCPMCQNEFDAETVYFYRCTWRFDGKKKVNGDTKKCDSQWRTASGRTFQYFDDKIDDKKVTWLKLTFYIKDREY